MKKIGLVGGIGPASTIEYYRGLILRCSHDDRVDGYPEIVIDSVNMLRHDQAITEKNYDLLAEYLIKSLDNLKAAGAQIAAITANTEHIVWERIKDRLPLETVSVVDAVTEKIKKEAYRRVLILGTKWTMESGLFEQPVENAGAIPVILEPQDQRLVGELIYPNLENGIVLIEDKQKMLQIIEQYCKKQKADSVLLGCSELPLMIKENDLSVPVINSTEVHLQKIFNCAVGIPEGW